ncbi:unnamed protein product [Vitrella brassicaformis CCMP3155]|uniref:Uncharacterized protein n=1 Tax=Vitrella brassicaformis (strain CCMP3155) TaxID=1169540 RepID=A0A0G4EBB8_VITBC|nr:unnamed protein product [Vitrella brassicaformis CCMP3155]|mmetsp:Transcript_20900/g.59606  ORF Transcript_20900/g.59606 Transcript_20900/m.59606 type:complete len:335 (+) Transcript_20900:169-1173(+)|eukprot:CEL93250.1 unnamed protein product [Vitrella brassicaformis CCMP3155]
MPFTFGHHVVHHVLQRNEHNRLGRMLFRYLCFAASKKLWCERQLKSTLYLASHPRHLGLALFYFFLGVPITDDTRQHHRSKTRDAEGQFGADDGFSALAAGLADATADEGREPFSEPSDDENELDDDDFNLSLTGPTFPRPQLAFAPQPPHHQNGTVSTISPDHTAAPMASSEAPMRGSSSQSEQDKIYFLEQQVALLTKTLAEMRATQAMSSPPPASAPSQPPFPAMDVDQPAQGDSAHYTTPTPLKGSAADVLPPPLFGRPPPSDTHQEDGSPMGSPSGGGSPIVMRSNPPRNIGIGSPATNGFPAAAAAYSGSVPVGGRAERGDPIAWLQQ